MASSAFIRDGLSPETHVQPSGMESSTCYSQPRPPSQSSRFVSQTLGKLKLDYNRCEQSGRFRTPRPCSQAKSEASTAVSPEPRHSSKDLSSSDAGFTGQCAPSRNRPSSQMTERPEMRYRPSSQMTERMETPDESLRQCLPDLSSPSRMMRPDSRVESVEARAQPDWLNTTVESSRQDDMPPEWSGSWPAWSQEFTGRPWIIADLLRWRSSFHQEMEDATRGVRAALEEANIPSMVAEFAEWRRNESQERRDLQHHVEELLRVNTSLRQSQLDWFATKGVEQIVESAIGKAVEATTLSVGALWQDRIDEFEKSVKNISDSSSQLQGVEDMIGNAFQELKNHQETTLSSALQQLDALTSQVEEQKMTMTKSLENTVTKELTNQMEELKVQFHEAVDHVSPQLHHEIEEIKDHLEFQLTNSQKKRTTTITEASEIQSLLQDRSLSEDKLTAAAHGFQELQQTLLKECDEWQHKYVEAEIQLVNSRALDEKHKFEIQELEQKVRALDIKVMQAESRSGVNVINRIKQIEKHGNVTVNLDNGDVDMLKPLEFVPRNQGGEPTAEFAQITQATSVIDDISDLQRLFNVKVEVEGHTKGDSPFFEKLASNRAMLIKDHLVANGTNPRLIETKSLPGLKGLNRPCVIVRLDIFPDND